MCDETLTASFSGEAEYQANIPHQKAPDRNSDMRFYSLSQTINCNHHGKPLLYQLSQNSNIDEEIFLIMTL